MALTLGGSAGGWGAGAMPGDGFVWHGPGPAPNMSDAEKLKSMGYDRTKYTAAATASASPASSTGSATPSPTAAPAGSAVSTVQTRSTQRDSELYKVNPATDTVRGQLDNNYTDTNSLLMKRYASQGRADAVSRGLTNSTIASQGAMGKVLDKAGEFATTDAQIYNARKDEALRSDTAVETSLIGAEASKYGADRQLEGTKLAASTDVDVANLNNAAAQTRLETDNSSTEAVAEASRASQERIAAADNAARQRVARMDSNTQIKLRELDISFENSKVDREIRDSIYADTANGINNIDPNASPASQSNQAKRILDYSAIRLKAYEDMIA